MGQQPIRALVFDRDDKLEEGIAPDDEATAATVSVDAKMTLRVPDASFALALLIGCTL